LKLNDADLEQFLLKGNKSAFSGPTRTETPVPGVETPGRTSFAPGMETPPEAGVAPEPGVAAEEPNPFRESVSDLKSALPLGSKDVLNEAREVIGSIGANETWEREWGTKTVKIKPSEETK